MFSWCFNFYIFVELTNFTIWDIIIDIIANWQSFLESNKILLKKLFKGLLDKICPKTLILGINYFTIYIYVSQSRIFYDRNVFWQVLGSSTIWEYIDKIWLKNIKAVRGINIFCNDTQTKIFIMFLLSVPL